MMTGAMMTITRGLYYKPIRFKVVTILHFLRLSWVMMCHHLSLHTGGRPRRRGRGVQHGGE
jgi:hypothetical protein